MLGCLVEKCPLKMFSFNTAIISWHFKLVVEWRLASVPVMAGLGFCLEERRPRSQALCLETCNAYFETKFFWQYIFNFALKNNCLNVNSRDSPCSRLH